MQAQHNNAHAHRPPKADRLCCKRCMRRVMGNFLCKAITCSQLPRAIALTLNHLYHRAISLTLNHFSKGAIAFTLYHLYNRAIALILNHFSNQAIALSKTIIDI